MSDFVLFGVFPYLSLGIAVSAGLYRYFSDRFSYSSFSSQFFENRQLFWGSISWHYGIVIILLAHLLAALFPRMWSSIIGSPLRLFILEGTGMALGVLTVVGIALLILRRLTNPRVFAVTTFFDWALLLLFIVQVLLGLSIALFYRWGASWYIHTAAPWFWSLVRFDPQVQFIASLPPLVKFHVVNAFLIVALFPFSRLVHIFTIPLSYLWRPYQIVYWNRRPGQER